MEAARRFELRMLTVQSDKNLVVVIWLKHAGFQAD